ncbi:TMEM175 family protein [Companilactobacillus farciminis]|uniref:TMEM175 family protein n=1 Tax=Companilactobacillus farciminis TaxID=1612 RepID=UPI0034D56AED
MNKGRVEAFTDAIVAIIMTIMVLELKTPESSTFQSFLNEKTYFIAYLISFFLIATTWYNHHYLFANSNWISKRAFWANCAWLFLMSLTPVSTAWISKFPHSLSAAYLYFILYTLWGLAFEILLSTLIKDNPTQASRLKLMRSRGKNIFEISSFVIGLILIYFIPYASFAVLAVDILVWIVFTPKNSDRIIAK